MTSMPASRRARAMIFAPRSCPSRPGFAITTLIFRAPGVDIGRQYTAVRLRVIGSSPAWPNPGGACSGYLVEGRLLLDRGPGVLAKLREQEAWPTVEAIAITHLHLDHWGDLVPWVWGSLFGPGESLPKPELWLPPGSREQLRPVLATLGTEDMFDRAFEVSEYEARAELAQDADLLVSEATLENGGYDGPDRGHLSPAEVTEAVADVSALRVVLTHRPVEREAPPGFELAYDGLELEF